MKLMVPLQHYDEAGRIKPPWLFWLLLLFIARSYLVFVGSMSFRQDSAALLSLFYPKTEDFYWGLLVGMPAVLLFLLSGFRHKLWLSGLRRVFAFTRPLLLVALLTDLALQLLVTHRQHWQFAWLSAFSILSSLALFSYCWRSQHIREMFRDWQQP